MKQKKKYLKFLVLTPDEHVSSYLCKLEPWSKTIGCDRLLNYNHHKYSMNAPFNGAFAFKSAL